MTVEETTKEEAEMKSFKVIEGHENIIEIIENKGQVQYPQQQSAYARKDTTKYCQFYRGYGYDTSKCYQLCDHIGCLIRN
ncbi:hypothetical protein Dsin_001692, partial [Dipteronia sinensis]